MSTNTLISDELAEDILDTLARKVDNGTIRVYSGTPPSSVGAALSGNTLLAECAIPATSAPAAGGVTARTLIFNAITDDSAINNSGIASFYRMFDASDNAHAQGTASTAGESMTLTDTSLVQNGVLEISSVIMTM